MQVREFHERFGHPVRTTPTIPPDDEIRFRLKLIAEEFFELLESCGVDVASHDGMSAAEHVLDGIVSSTLKVDFPEFVDALGDLDFVVEGGRIIFGVDGTPIANEIARANLDKHPSGPTKKPTKPEGWKGPMIEVLLLEQGWRK